MFNKLAAVVSVFLISATVVLAAPEADAIAAALSYPCANDAGATCPRGYTCCGPILAGVGGTCRKLKPGQVCIF